VEARRLTDHAIELSKEANDAELLAESLADSAALRYANDDHEGAYHDRVQSAIQYQVAKNFDRQALELRVSAEDLHDLNKDEEARTALLKALSIADNSGTPETRYWIHRDLGRL